MTLQESELEFIEVKKLRFTQDNPVKKWAESKTAMIKYFQGAEFCKSKKVHILNDENVVHKAVRQWIW